MRVSTDAGSVVTTAHLPHPTHDLAAQMYPEVSLPLGQRLKNLALFPLVFISVNYVIEMDRDVIDNFRLLDE